MGEALLAPLLPYADPSIAAHIAASDAPMPAHAIGGYLGRLRFIVTVDQDGQIECSLSQADARPTQAQIAAFFRKWGMPAPSEKPTVICRGRGLHWVLRGPMNG